MTIRRHHPLLVTLVVMTVLVLALSACGRKGSPKPPEGREAAYTYPHAYPATNTTGPVGPNEDAQKTRGLLSIFEGAEEEPDADAEPDSVLILPPPEENSRFSGQGAPSVVPKSRTKTRTY